MTRADCLDTAKAIVCGNRVQQYGSPEDSFHSIAQLWTAYTGYTITDQDVAIMMALLKIARIKGNVFKADSFVDCAGYIACAAEIASKREFLTEGEENAEN